jgi:hypothetical protein
MAKQDCVCGCTGTAVPTICVVFMKGNFVLRQNGSVNIGTDDNATKIYVSNHLYEYLGRRPPPPGKPDAAAQHGFEYPLVRALRV